MSRGQMVTAVLAVLLLAAAGICIYLFYRNRRMYRTIDGMLDDVLNREIPQVSDIREGEISALAGKVKRVQERIELEITHAESEKESVKRLISDLSHQLKTPLANIMMYEEILANPSLSQEQREEFLRRMQGQSAKLDWLLQSLFKMTRLEQNVITFEAEGQRIRATLLDAVGAVYEKAEKKRIGIHMEDHADAVLYHNRKWTAEVFENLLENAVKYTPEGGSIWIRIKPMEMYTGIEVEDTGMGIAKEEYQRIFERFYRSKSAEQMEGSGIGLYLSRMILEKEKGYVTVSSVLGQGSCFTVFLQNCQN